jgi:hypothetical protein
MITAYRNGVAVDILNITIGNPKNCADVCIVYCGYETGTIEFDVGNSEIFNNYVIVK